MQLHSLATIDGDAEPRGDESMTAAESILGATGRQEI